jgi:uncharacterized ubiquitin-like protein YukD
MSQGFTVSQQTDTTKIPLTQKGAAGGVATLDSNSFVPMSELDSTAVAALAPVQSVAGKTGTVTLDNTDVGLPNVTNDAQIKVSQLDTDNTFTANLDTKVASQKATKSYIDTGLGLKVDKTVTINGHALSSNVTVTKSDISLGSVDNLQQLPMSYLDVDTTLTANSDTKVASQKAIKAYVDSGLSGKVSTSVTVNGHALSSNVTVTKSDVSLGSVDNIQQLPLSYLDLDTALVANSDTKVASQKAIKAYVDSGLSGKQNSLGFTAENVANKDTDNTLSSNSDTKYPSQKAIKAYVDTAESNHLSASDPHTQYIKVDGTRVFTGNQALGGYKITGAAAASAAGQYVEYAQWQAALSGTNLINSVVEPDLFNDSLSAPPGSPVTEAGYLVGPSPTGAWSGKAGHIMAWTGSAWNDQLGRAVAIGDKFVVTIEFGIGSEGGNMVGNHNNVLTMTNATPGSYAYTVASPAINEEFSVWAATSLHNGDRYHYEGTQWIELPAPTANLPGSALAASGTTWNVQVDGTTINVNGSNQLAVPANTFDAYGSAVTAQGNSLQKSSNLSDLTSTSSARTNIGLGNVSNVNQLPLSYLDTDNTLTSNSDLKVPSQKAIKSYVDTGLSGKVATTVTVNGHALSSNVTVTATDVGLGNVSNVNQIPLSYLDTDVTLTANSDTKVASQKAIKAYVDSSDGLKVDKTTTVNGHALSGNISVTQTDVGLSNLTNVAQLPMSYLDIDNTLAANSDSKVPSQKAIKAYVDNSDGLLVLKTTTVNGHALSANISVTATDVGLGNVNNTSDSAKIIAGDVTGNLGASTVVKLQNRTLASTAPSAKQSLGWNATSSQWEPQTVAVLWSANTVANSTLALTASSNRGQIFTGTVGGQVVSLPDATTLTVGEVYYLVNHSDPAIVIKDNSGVIQTMIITTTELKAILVDNSTTAGVWNLCTTDSVYEQVDVYDDFISTVTTSNQIGSLGWVITTGTAAYQTTTGSSFGVIRVNSSTANNGVGSLNLGTNLPILINNASTFMEMRMSFPSVGGTGANQFSLHAGLLNATTVTTPGTDPTVGIGFRFHGTAATAGNIFGFAANTTVSTVDSGVQVVAGTWYKGSLIINAAGTVAYFYLNNVFIGSINTNMPTTQVMAPNIKVSAGSTNAAAKAVDLDFFEMIKLYPTVR